VWRMTRTIPTFVSSAYPSPNLQREAFGYVFLLMRLVPQFCLRLIHINAQQRFGFKAIWLWRLAFFVVVTIGELYLSPIGLSLVSKVAPARVLSLMMGLWLATSFIGNLIAGWLGGLWSGMDNVNFFLMIAAFAAGAGVATSIFIRPLKPILDR
jgi:dipeptide/tripeptide permease